MRRRLAVIVALAVALVALYEAQLRLDGMIWNGRTLVAQVLRDL
jgi:hypothetical protein